jgi:hypothetical protein
VYLSQRVIAFAVSWMRRVYLAQSAITFPYHVCDLAYLAQSAIAFPYRRGDRVYLCQGAIAFRIVNAIASIFPNVRSLFSPISHLQMDSIYSTHQRV